MTLTLDEIGQKHGTDKRTGASAKMHGYLPHYDFFFRELRDQKISLLEVGVYHGASLAMWRDYFPNAEIVGVDINPDAQQYSGDRVTIEIMDQANKLQLAELGAKHGPFDIVIDDGSHRWDHQRITFVHMLKHVKSGGFFVIEDIHTSFQERYKGKDTTSFVEHLITLARHLVDPALSPLPEDDTVARHVIARVASITFLKRAAIIRVA